MSFSLFRQVASRAQPLLNRRIGQVVAFRLNSTSPPDLATDSNMSPWTQIIHAETEKKPSDRPTKSIEHSWKHKFEEFENHGKRVHDIYDGRSVKIENGIDLASAAKFLDRVLAQNSVGKDWFTNRRHRQKGEERRRLRSIRWRRRFRNEVGKKVQLVQAIRRRGA